LEKPRNHLRKTVSKRRGPLGRGKGGRAVNRSHSRRSEFGCKRGGCNTREGDIPKKKPQPEVDPRKEGERSTDGKMVSMHKGRGKNANSLKSKKREEKGMKGQVQREAGRKNQRAKRKVLFWQGQGRLFPQGVNYYAGRSAGKRR